MQLAALKKELQGIEGELFFGINDVYSLSRDIKNHEREGKQGLGKMLFLLGIAEVNIVATVIILMYVYRRCQSN